jgi:hypothetical protein
MRLKTGTHNPLNECRRGSNLAQCEGQQGLALSIFPHFKAIVLGSLQLSS